MAEGSALISKSRCERIREQGYQAGYTDEEISQLAVGNRFAYQLCTVVFGAGLLLGSIPILAVAGAIAFLGVVLPYHPFDYVFNHGVRRVLDKPRQPRRSPQAKFACGLAAVTIGLIIFAFSSSLFVVGYVLGGVLLVVALLVSTVDICIPSMTYNRLFDRSSRT
ncbi:MAG: DUF4395 family protein [Halobacteriales archaeon]|nr:DUF4395 family protein [Halobacteriales archaeon]